MEMGFECHRWTAAPHKAQNIDEVISEGLHLKDDRIFCGPPKKALLCNVGQFERPFDEKDPANLYVPAEFAFLLEQFNKLSTRVEELTEEVRKLRKESEPKKLDKPNFSP